MTPCCNEQYLTHIKRIKANQQLPFSPMAPPILPPAEEMPVPVPTSPAYITPPRPTMTPSQPTVPVPELNQPGFTNPGGMPMQNPANIPMQNAANMPMQNAANMPMQNAANMPMQNPQPTPSGTNPSYIQIPSPISFDWQLSGGTAPLSPILAGDVTDFIGRENPNITVGVSSNLEGTFEVPPNPLLPEQYQNILDYNTVQYANGFYRTQIGRLVLVQHLIGSNNIATRYGYLVAVGTNYILLQDAIGNIALVDSYSIKYFYVFYHTTVLPPTNLNQVNSSATALQEYNTEASENILESEAFVMPEVQIGQEIQFSDLPSSFSQENRAAEQQASPQPSESVNNRLIWLADSIPQEAKDIMEKMRL